MINVHYPCISDVGTIFFESDTQHQDGGFLEGDIFFYHQFYDFLRNKPPHSIIDPSSCQYHFRMVSYLLGFERQIIRVYSEDRKSTRLNSSHVAISYAVFCLKKKK